MPITQPPDVLKLLAHDVRWSLIQALRLSDYRVHELVEQLETPMNLISYHLKLMREAGIVMMHKSEADGRDVYYSLEHDALRHMFEAAGGSLYPAHQAEDYTRGGLKALSPLRVLFVCTHNSARSQMAEALLRESSSDAIAAFSAGSHPSDIHPDAIRTMQMMKIDIHTQKAKHWNLFSGQSFDYVITVCDRAREICPVFPNGQIMHWSFPDPAAVQDVNARQAAFEQTAAGLKARIRLLLDVIQQAAA